MDDELVLLSSYFNLVGGRRQDTADTFRVDTMLPSRSAPDGSARLFIITEASGSGTMGNRARRLAADTIAWEYSARSEDPPARRLKTSLRAADAAVRQEFDGHVAIGASIVAIEERNVFLAQASPAQVCVIHEGRLSVILGTTAEGGAFSQALGAEGGAQIAVYRDEIGAGDVLALCSSAFETSVMRGELEECFEADNVDDIASCLEDLAMRSGLRDCTAIVIEVVPAEEAAATEEGEEPESFSDRVDEAVQALATVGRLFWAELLTPGTPIEPNGRQASRVAIEEGGESGSRPVRNAAVQDEVEEERPEEPPEPRRGVRSWRKRAQTKVDEEWNPELTSQYDLSALAENPAPVRERPEQATQEIAALDDTFAAEEERAAGTLLPDDERTGELDLGRLSGIPGDPHVPKEEAETEEEWDEVEWQEVEPLSAVETPSNDFHTVRTDPLHPQTELEEVNSRLNDEVDLGGDVIPPVQGFPDASTVQPERIYATNKELRKVNRRPRRFSGRDAAPVVRPPVSDIDLRRPVRRPAPPAAVWFAAALVCACAVLAVALFILHRHGNTVASDPYPALVRKDLRLARASKVPSSQDKYLATARANIALAIKAGAPAATVHQLRLRYQTASDAIYTVTRETAPVAMAHFQQPAEIANSPDLVYILDRGAKGVFQVTPNTTSGPTEIVQPGETDTGFTIGTPVHIATAGEIALVLDDKNTLVRDNGGTKSATTLQSPSSAKENIVEMANSGPDIYVLDSAAGQIWRYADAVNSDNSAPAPFLPGNVTLSSPVSFTLDDTDLYVLEASGQILKLDLTTGAAQSFKNTTTLRIPLKHPDAIFTDVGLPYVWVADPGNGRIVQLDKNGDYVRSYAAGSQTGMNLSKVKGMVVPGTDKTLYVLAGRGLYSFPVVP